MKNTTPTTPTSCTTSGSGFNYYRTHSCDEWDAYSAAGECMREYGQMAQSEHCASKLGGMNSCSTQCQGRSDMDNCMLLCLGDCDVDGWRACCEQCNPGNQT